MNDITSKGNSPFHPGQPVPVELFVGRYEQIERIMTRGVGQVTGGKSVAIYVQGEYGIGKSSIARFVKSLAEAEEEKRLHGIYASLGGARDLNDVAAAVLEATVRSGAFDPTRNDKIREWLAKYGKQELFGFSVNLETLRKDAPNISTPFSMLGFLSEAKTRLESAGVKGIFLILDEINGISANPQFSHFIKGLVDTNAISEKPLPLLLMLCGVEERRREMIEKHQPIERIFDVINIETMKQNEMEQFFNKAFESVHMTVEPAAMKLITHFSDGFPKMMHMIGDSAYWHDKDGVVDERDAFGAIEKAAFEVGSKYVDQQVFKALRSADYRSILDKIADKIGKAASPPDGRLAKKNIFSDLSESEKKKFNNFIGKMQELKVLRPGDVRGEYVFNNRMVMLYIFMERMERRSRNPKET